MWILGIICTVVLLTFYFHRFVDKNSRNFSWKIKLALCNSFPPFIEYFLKNQISVIYMGYHVDIQRIIQHQLFFVPLHLKKKQEYFFEV